MGLFGFVGKIVGGIVKAGASAVTGGLSDHVVAAISKKSPQPQAYSYRPAAYRAPAGALRGIAGLLAVKNTTGTVVGYSRPLVRTQGIIQSPGGYASASPVMPGGAPILGLADPVRVSSPASSPAGGGRKKKRRASTARKKRSSSTRKRARSSAGKKVRYKGGWYSRKQVANMKRFARRRGR